MWFCFFPPLSKAIQERYCYSFSSNKQPGKQNPLMDMDKKEGTATILPKVPPESWSRKKAAKGTEKKITQPFQSRRQSSVLCWLLQLRKIPIYADRSFFSPALAVTGLCKQDAHLQQRHRRVLETALLSPRASPGLSDWL